MSITARGYSSGSATGTGSAQNVTVTLPTGWQASDVAIVWLVNRGSTSPSAPTGWTAVPNTSQNIAGVYGAQAYYRALQSGDSGPTFSVTATSGDGISWVCGAYTGVDNTTPIDKSASDQSSTNTTSHVSPSITPAFNSDMLVLLYATNVEGTTYSSPSLGTLEIQIDAATGTSGSNTSAIAALCDVLLSSSSATGNQTLTASSSSTYIGAQIGLKDATAVGPKVVFITSGSGTWTLPTDWPGTADSVEIIGAGGNGFAVSTAGGGGGGGAYAKITSLAISTNPSYQVGAGGGTRGTSASPGTADTWFKAASTLYAQAGANATSATGAAGGAATACVPTTGAQNGGAGGNNDVVAHGGSAGNYGGGGGGAGGPSAAGTAGTGASTTPTGGHGDGTAGGAGGTKSTSQTTANGSPGAEWTQTSDSSTAGSGGGGAGGDSLGDAAGNGGNYGGGGGGSVSTGTHLGAGGLIVITYTPAAGPTIDVLADVPGQKLHRPNFIRSVRAPRTVEKRYQPTLPTEDVQRARPKAFKRIWRLLRSNREHPEGFTSPVIPVEHSTPKRVLKYPRLNRWFSLYRHPELIVRTTLPKDDVERTTPKRVLHIPRLSRWLGLHRHPELTIRTTLATDYVSSHVPKQKYTRPHLRRFVSQSETFTLQATPPEHSIPRAFKQPKFRSLLGNRTSPELSHQINTTDVRWSVPRVTKTGVRYRLPLSIRVYPETVRSFLPEVEGRVPKAFNRHSYRLNANIRQHPELSTRTTLPSDYVHSSVPRVTKERTKYRINLNVRQHPETVASFLPSVEHNVPRAFNRRSYKLNLNIRQHPELITQATTVSEFIRFSVPRISKTGVRYRLNLCIRLHPELLVSFVPAVEHNIPKGFKRRSYKLNPNIRQHPELSHQINTTDVQAHVQRRSRLRNYPFQLKPPYRGTTSFAPTPIDAPARVSRRIKYGRLFRFRSSTTPVVPFIVDALSRVSRRIRPNRTTYRRTILNAENTQQVNTTTVQSRVFRPRFVYALRQPYHVTFPIGHTLLVPVQVSFVGATSSTNITLQANTPSTEITPYVTPSLSAQLIKSTSSTDIEIVSVQATR